MLEQKFKPNSEKLNIKPVEITTTGKEQKYVNHDKEVREVLPQIYYYNAVILTSDIITLEVESSSFLPMCYLTFNDSQNMMDDLGFPTDNATVTVVLPSGHPNLANIFLTFKIIEYDQDTIANDIAKRISIVGILNIDDILIKEYNSYNMSSYDTLTEIAKKSGTGFMSNIDSTADKMIWLNPGERNYNFIQDVVKKSWVSDESFMVSFVDFYYNLNFIDVEKQLSQDIKEIAWVKQNRIDNETPKETDVATPMLSNNKSLQQNNNYFTGENVVNKSTDVSLQRGYTRNVHYYDIDGNWDKKAGAYKVYGLDTISSSKNGDNKIVLKGDGNSDFFTKNKSYIYMGKLDTKNVFPDYLWARVQNYENNIDLDKISMDIILPTPNFNIRRYEKIKLVYTKENVGVSGRPGSAKLNGEWLVTKIKFNKVGTSMMYQTLTLIKRELEIGGSNS
jgi:hypothetical protein